MRLGISAIEILAFHQPDFAADPAFEVASIKPGNPRNPATLLNYSNPRLFLAENMSLRALIMFAWNVTEQQILDAPRWADTERWDITARTESPLPRGNAVNEPIRALLRNLLPERFSLIVRTRPAGAPAWALVVDKGGTKLRAVSQTDTDSPGTSAGNRFFNARKMPIETLTRFLSTQLGRTVIDQTGLTGDFTFRLDFEPETTRPLTPDAGDPESTHPGILTALREQTGLRIEPSKTPAEALVMERAARPSAN
jgi:uncharacterized protein (TIGR03435 family)